MVEIMPSVENTQARILVIGVGGAGNNAVNRMVDENVQGVELVGIANRFVFFECNNDHSLHYPYIFIPSFNISCVNSKLSFN